MIKIAKMSMITKMIMLIRAGSMIKIGGRGAKMIRIAKVIKLIRIAKVITLIRAASVITFGTIPCAPFPAP